LRKFAVGDSEHAVAITTQFFIFFQEIILDEVNHQMDFVIDLVMRASLINVFHRTLADQHVIALVIHRDGHAFALKIERNLIYLFAPVLHVQIGVRKNRTIQQVAQPGLIVTVHVGVAQNVVAITVSNINRLFEDHPILCKGARLIGAENIDSAEVLNRV